jgi:hypothetical protein
VFSLAYSRKAIKTKQHGNPSQRQQESFVPNIVREENNRIPLSLFVHIDMHTNIHYLTHTRRWRKVKEERKEEKAKEKRKRK